jgi:hypothetical protein
MADTTHKFLSATAVTIIKGAYTADNAAANKWIKARDIMISEGITHTMLAEDDSLRVWFKGNVIIPTMSKDDQGLITLSKAGAKALSPERKKARREAQQQIGSKLAKVIKHLTPEKDKSEPKSEPATDTDTDTDTGNDTVSLADKLRKELSAMVVRIQKDEDPEGFDPAKLCKALGVAIALIR